MLLGCVSVSASPLFTCLVSCKYSQLLANQAEATVAINDFMAGLYHEGVFIRSERANHLAMRGMTFLKLYVELAQISFSQRKQRFPLVPKGHYLHHQMLQLLHESQASAWSLNPLIFACQAQEDFVGKPSRLARRTNPRKVSQRVIQRNFLAIRNALQAHLSDDEEGT